MRLAELTGAEVEQISTSNVFDGTKKHVCLISHYLPLHTIFSVNSYIIIGETYQVDGTIQNAFCRSKRLIPVTECYTKPCPLPVCLEPGNYLRLFSYSLYFGLVPTDLNTPAPNFICEEP
jgi:hypothetical protein